MGLIQAYKAAALEALDAAEIVEHELFTRYVLKFDFEYINPVMMLLRNYGAITIDSDTDINGYIWTVDIYDRDIERFEKEASALYKLKVKKKTEEDE